MKMNTGKASLLTREGRRSARASLDRGRYEVRDGNLQIKLDVLHRICISNIHFFSQGSGRNATDADSAIVNTLESLIEVKMKLILRDHCDK